MNRVYGLQDGWLWMNGMKPQWKPTIGDGPQGLIEHLMSSPIIWWSDRVYSQQGHK